MNAFSGVAPAFVAASNNPLSFYASILGFQVQHAESRCNEALISARRETQYDQPMEEEEAIITLPSPVELTQPFVVGPNNATSTPKKSPPARRQTRSESRMADCVIPSILEPPMDDDSEQEGGLTGSIAAKDRAASSLVKRPASKGPPKSADQRNGQLSVAMASPFLSSKSQLT